MAYFGETSMSLDTVSWFLYIFSGKQLSMTSCCLPRGQNSSIKGQLLKKRICSSVKEQILFFKSWPTFRREVGAPVAQWVEHLLADPAVPSLIPGGRNFFQP